MLVGLLANGHLLLESLSGLAKTRAVKSLAKNLDAAMRRIHNGVTDAEASNVGATIHCIEKDVEIDQLQFRPSNFLTISSSSGAAANVRALSVRDWPIA